jgi:serine/threonine-protein phosphatase PGAM5
VAARTMGRVKASKPPSSTEHLHVVHLLRHGQYVRSAGATDGPLTVVGRKQARAAAKYLRRWPIERIWASDARRASETARIVARSLGATPFKLNSMLREVVPTRVNGRHVPLDVRAEGRAAIERIAVELLRSTRSTRHDLIVCHGNLIRALVCYVLNTPRTTWVQLATHHCAVTTIAITAQGRRMLVRYGETGYLSEALLTEH